MYLEAPFQMRENVVLGSTYYEQYGDGFIHGGLSPTHGPRHRGRVKIEASNRVVDDDGIVLVNSFWRHDCLIYMALRDAGLTHEQAAHQIRRRYSGGAPRPRFFGTDEIELVPQTNKIA